MTTGTSPTRIIIRAGRAASSTCPARRAYKPAWRACRNRTGAKPELPAVPSSHQRTQATGLREPADAAGRYARETKSGCAWCQGCGRPCPYAVKCVRNRPPMCHAPAPETAPNKQKQAPQRAAEHRAIAQHAIKAREGDHNADGEHRARNGITSAEKPTSARMARMRLERAP